MSQDSSFNRKHIATRIAHIDIPRSFDLLTLLVDAIASLDDEEEVCVVDETAVRKLCEAYCVSSKNESYELGIDDDCLVGEEAEKFFREIAHKAFCMEIPDAKIDSEEVPSLPECLPRDTPLPRELLTELGKILGFREAVRTHVFESYCDYYSVDGVM